MSLLQLLTEQKFIVYGLYRRGELVYIGKTNRPEDREAEHHRDQNNPKDFDQLRKIAGPFSEEVAKEREALALRHYRIEHNGNNPEYNLTPHG